MLLASLCNKTHTHTAVEISTHGEFQEAAFPEELGSLERGGGGGSYCTHQRLQSETGVHVVQVGRDKEV